MLDNQDELFVVVDAHDMILGYRTRYDCHHDKTLIHRVTGVFVFDGDRFLLQKRSMKKDLQPGVWGVSVGGHVLKGETYKQAARREMQEELGVTPPPLRLLKQFTFHGTQETEISHLFTCEHKGPFILDPDEVSEVRFFTEQELKDGLTDGTIRLSECAMETMRQIHIL